jgi:hypothetical protein
LGNWEMKTPKGKTIETWKKTKDSLVGKSYQIDLKGDSVLLEKVAIKDIKGSLYYCVTGAGHAETINFKMVPSGNGLLIFENNENDFPQRIIYQNKGENELLAWIEGLSDGKETKYEFPYLKQKN